MGKINILSFAVANLIAAGEVVDRPASVIKELTENAIDAGADRITIEIQNGGVAFMRVSDNGCGIEADDLPRAIRRHATSKIKEAEDLDGIMTLGFRGEALAAIAAVSDLRIISRPRGAHSGASIEVCGGDIQGVTERGCSEGTTVIAENLFFNVPARRKFLKRDVTEAAAVAAVVEKIALSHPEISFTFISDGETKLETVGDGKLLNTIYAIYGREFAKGLIEVSYEHEGIVVSGYTGRPGNVKPNRNGQTFFINGRFIKSKTATAALEQAYVSHIPPEKFPVCVLNITISPKAVDVNVHPAKLEVKFSNEKPVFEAVYYGVKNALDSSTARPDIKAEIFSRMTYEEYRKLFGGGKNLESAGVGQVNRHEAAGRTDYIAEKANSLTEAEPRHIKLPNESRTPEITSEPPASKIDESIKANTDIKTQAEQPLKVSKIQTYQQTLMDFPHQPSLRTENLTAQCYIEEYGNQAGRYKPASDISRSDGYKAAAPKLSPNDPIKDDEKAMSTSATEISADTASDFVSCCAERNTNKTATINCTKGDTAHTTAIFRADSVPSQMTETMNAESDIVCPPDMLSTETAHSADTPDGDSPPVIPPYRIIGEGFNSYVIVETEDKLLFIDKHAAHERIIFEKLKSGLSSAAVSSQVLMLPIEFMLTSDEALILNEYRDELEKIGFSFKTEKYTVHVTAIPNSISIAAVPDIFMTIADRIKNETGSAKLTRDIIFEKALYQASCKAAVKAGREYNFEHIEWIVKQLMTTPDITNCPHGRPVAMEISKRSLDRQFGRT